jgi:biopolymer transport protein ExbD
MPVKLNSKLPENAEARIEIIPLIDIMFFLLAAFMLVSLSMVNLKSLKVNLPTATAAVSTSDKKGILDVSVDKAGSVFLDKRPVTDNQLVLSLASAHASDPNVKIFITADRDSRHGQVINVLDLVRSAGIDKVAFEIRPQDKGTTP